MSVGLRVTVLVEQDGVEIARVVRRQTVDEAQSFNYEKATGGGYVTAPISELSDLFMLLFQPVDQQVTVRLNGQSDAGIVINPGGLLLLVDTDFSSGASTLATVDNSSGSTARITGVAGGT